MVEPLYRAGRRDSSGTAASSTGFSMIEESGALARTGSEYEARGRGTGSKYRARAREPPHNSLRPRFSFDYSRGRLGTRQQELD